VVVVVDANQVSKLQMASHASSLAGDTLHGASITEKEKCVVVDQVEAILVVDGGGVCLGNGKTNGISEALAEWSSCDFDTWGIMRLRMTRCDAIYRAEGLDVVEANGVAKKMKKRILKHATVTIPINSVSWISQKGCDIQLRYFVAIDIASPGGMILITPRR
jgi:hypothetical protein